MQELQKIFDLITQQAKKGKKSHSKSHCLYRDDNGNRCFIGCLIGDDVYNDKLEATTGGVTHPYVQKALQLSGWCFSNYALLHEIQAIHDAYSPDQWREALENFAQINHLNFNW